VLGGDGGALICHYASVVAAEFNVILYCTVLYSFVDQVLSLAIVVYIWTWYKQTMPNMADGIWVPVSVWKPTAGGGACACTFAVA
jgi:hypothetical protein